jgi:hypothetical protein
MDEQRRWKLGHFRLSDQILGFTVFSYPQQSSNTVDILMNFIGAEMCITTLTNYTIDLTTFAYVFIFHSPTELDSRSYFNVETFTHPLVLYSFFYSHWLLDKSVSRRIGRPSTTGEWVADLCWWLLFCTISLTPGMFNELWGRILIHFPLFLYTNSPSYHLSPASSPGPPRKPKSHWRRRVFHSNTPRVPRLFYLPFLFYFTLFVLYSVFKYKPLFRNCFSYVLCRWIV